MPRVRFRSDKGLTPRVVKDRDPCDDEDQTDDREAHPRIANRKEEHHQHSNACADVAAPGNGRDEPCTASPGGEECDRATPGPNRRKRDGEWGGFREVEPKYQRAVQEGPGSVPVSTRQEHPSRRCSVPSLEAQ